MKNPMHLAMIAGALIAAVPAQAEDFTFDTTRIASSTGPGFGNAMTFTSNVGTTTVTMKATGWARDFNGNYTTGELASWSGAGLGIYQQGDSRTGNYHQIDNVNGWEFVVLQFDQLVSLQSAVLTPYQLADRNYTDADAFVGWTTTAYGKILTAADMGTIGTSPSGWFNSNNADYPTTTQAYNLSSPKSGNLWIIGGSVDGPDRLNDAFKLGTLKVSAAVPEPATWAMMLVGFGMVGAAVRRSRRRDGAKPSFA